MIKYRLFPGYVISNTGERNVVSYNVLVQLYGLDPKECVKAGMETGEEEYIDLYPLPDGGYSKFLG